MERPMGPRAPPGGDRNRAFESIFGRPSAAHHAAPHPTRHSSGYSNGLGPPPGAPYGRAPSPSGYSGYAAGGAPPPQQPLRGQPDPRYSYGGPPPPQPPPPQSQPYGNYQQQGQYANEPYSAPPDARRQSAYDASGSMNSRASYAQSLPPEQFQPRPQVRHSIQYRNGATSSVEAGPDPHRASGQYGLASSEQQPRPPPPSDGMTPAQAYQAQVVRDDPRLAQHYPSGGPGGPPMGYNDNTQGRAATGGVSQSNFQSGSMRSVSMQQLGGQRASNEVPSLPPVDGFEPLDVDDLLEGPRMGSRRYPLRQHLDSDAHSLAESLGAAMLDAQTQPLPPLPPLPPHLATDIGGANYLPGRFMQNSPPPSSPSTFDTDGATGSTPFTQSASSRTSNDSVQTMPFPSNLARGQSRLHRRSSTTDGTRPNSSPPAGSTTSIASQANVRPTPQSVRALRGSNKNMPPLPRHSLPPSMAPSPSQSGSIMRHPAAPPRVITKPVYSALLSRVAEAFQARIAPSLSERTKDGLAYKDAFDGREAVTKLAEIIKTGDRNLALLLGRALDAQKFFHDVTYDHRLRDSSNELYQFKTALTTPFMSAEEVGASGMRMLPPVPRANMNGASEHLTRPGISPITSQQGVPSHSSSTNSADFHHMNGSASHPLPPLPGSASTDDHGGLPPPPPYSYGESLTPSSTLYPNSPNDPSRSPLSTISSSLPHAGPGRSPISPSSPDALDAATAAAVTAAAATTMDDAPLPSGVFTLLTECYSPTCTRDRLCYSIACPRRLEQIARLNLSQNGGSANDRAAGLSSGLSRGDTIMSRGSTAESSTMDADVESLSESAAARVAKVGPVGAGVAVGMGVDVGAAAAAELNNDTIVDVEPGTLWVHSVSQEVVDATPEKERRRQEAINELVYTERDFVRDMEYLRDQWVIPLTTRDIIPEARRKDFVTQVFWNIHEIIAVNTKLRDALTKRQKQRPVVEQIADIMMEHVGKFEPFIKYGAHQLYGKYEFEKEKNNNPLFSQFVDEVERLPESRKLELNGYLTKPTTRLARYPLLLGACLKVTEDDNPDKENIPQVIKIVKDFLERVNLESGRAENRFSLLQLDQQLVFRPGEAENLRLLDENRELVYKGPLKRAQGDNVDLQLFLFDHALLVVKSKTKHEQFKVHRKPIPLELLLISPTAEDPSIIRPGQGNRPRNTLVAKRNSLGTGGPQHSHQPFPLAAANNTLTRPTPGMHPLAPLPSDKADPKGGFPLTFIHLGRKGYTLTLWASTFVSRKKWIDAIVKQQEALRDRSTIFETWGISAGYFGPGIRVNCAAPLNHGQGIVMGTDDGVYFGDLRDTTRDPIKMLGIPEVTQVDVLEEYQLLVVLSERAVITFPLEALDPRDPTAGLKRAKRVSSHTSFFKAGMCLGKMLVCVVKASALSTTIKTLEPIETGLRGKNKPTFKKLLQGGNDTLKVFKEFYIPVESSSIHFLRTKLCVGCTKGFEIVDLETLDAQGLLDPNDSSLDFVQKRENVRPMAIYRVDSEFLLCYEDFAFYINKNGWRSRPGWIIHWEGTPTAFALHYPYVLAFEPTFIEVRHVETGLMAQVIVGTSIACLFADTPPSSDSAATHHQQQHHQQQQPQYHQQYPQHQIGYGQHPHPQGGYPAGGQRQSIYGAPPPPPPHGRGYPGPPPPRGYSAPMMHAPPPPPPPHRRDLHKRDEIILSMDDRVVGLRRAIGR